MEMVNDIFMMKADISVLSEVIVIERLHEADFIVQKIEHI
jgi:hypothetical protein